jgi:hypothetical protein
METEPSKAESPKRKRRWFSSPQNGLLLSLLAVEVFIFTSASFRWFAFNENKIRTALIAFGSVAVAMILPLVRLALAPLFRGRRWYQYGLRSLMILFLVVGIGMTWLVAIKRKAEKQKAAVDAIRKEGGWVQYGYEIDASGNGVAKSMPPEPAWLRDALGGDFFNNVVRVSIKSDAGMKYLKDFNDLQYLDLRDAKATNAALNNLTGLVRLNSLDLNSTGVTDDNLEHLEESSQLRELNLGSTGITDDGLQHLKGLSHLQVLDLGETRVSDAGLEHLKALIQLQKLSLYKTKVSDAGLGHVKGLSQLRELRLDLTGVSDAGLAQLTGLDALQSLGLWGCKITDVGLEHLHGLKNLRFIMLYGTRVTDEGVAKLQRLLPSCRIAR